jgi:hypothetical protein
MTAGNHIRYLKRQDLDVDAWDECIRSSPDGLLYARSFFLDAVTDGQWDALVLGDYEAVMPLTWNKKYGFTYLYQPHFVPVLGVFANRIPLPSLVDFLSVIPPHFRFWDFDCNETNTLPAFTSLPINNIRRKNYFLPLNHPGHQLRQDYKRLARRMLQKASGLNIDIVRGVEPGEVIEHFQLEYRRRLVRTPEEQYRRIAAAARLASAKGHLATYLAKKPNGEILAFYLAFQDDKFVYSVLGGSTEMGKEQGAFYLLTDAVIQDHSNSDRIFRFEGSDLAGIAFFNSQFGSYPVQYSHLVLNKLPFPINLLKKK